MNIEKLEKLEKWILDEPRRYYQNSWFCGPNSHIVQIQKPPCGTAHCLAGATCMMEGYLPKYLDFENDLFLNSIETPDGDVLVPDLAMKILGASDKKECHWLSRLFEISAVGWPEHARKLYREAEWTRNYELRAQAAALAIDDLIERCRIL